MEAPHNATIRIRADEFHVFVGANRRSETTTSRIAVAIRHRADLWCTMNEPSPRAYIALPGGPSAGRNYYTVADPCRTGQAVTARCVRAFLQAVHQEEPVADPKPYLPSLTFGTAADYLQSTRSQAVLSGLPQHRRMLPLKLICTGWLPAAPHRPHRREIIL